MIYIVLWLESLAVCVLSVLWGFTFWQQFSRIRALGRSAMVLPVLFALGVCAIQLIVSGVLYSHGFSTNYLPYSVSFAVVLVLVLVYFLVRGFRKDGEQRRIATWPLGRLGIAAIASIALYITTLMTTDTTMQMKLANVRLEAGALATSEAPPRPVERENAALVYARAFERIDAWKSSDLRKAFTKTYESSPSRWSDPNFDTKHPDLREYLAKMKTGLDLVRRAAAMPACAFDRSFAAPSPNMLLPELGKLRECTRLLAFDARCRAADGDIKGAFEDIRAIEGISEHLSYEPILISSLVSMACYNIGVETREAVLRSVEPSAADIESAWGNDDFFTFRRVFTRSMRGEHAFGLSAFTIVGESGDSNILNLIDTSNAREPSLALMARLAIPYWRVYLLPPDLRSYNDTMLTMEQSSTFTFNQGKATIASMQGRSVPRDGILTGMLVPALSRSFELFHTAEARLRLTSLARAVCMYRAENKAFPKSLDALVPDYISDIPVDPFDDKPLRLKAHPAGVTLYSVGPNEVDDGGLPPERNEPSKNDIVLRIGNVPDATPPAATSNAPKPAGSGF